MSTFALTLICAAGIGVLSVVWATVIWMAQARDLEAIPLAFLLFSLPLFVGGLFMLSLRYVL